MSVILSAILLASLIAAGLSLQNALWAGAALLMISAIRAPVRHSASLTAIAFAASLLLTSLALVAA